MATVSDLFIPGQFSNHDTLTLDGTLIPVHDQSITNPSKNYRRSVNVHVLATLDHQIVHVSQAWPGNRNDIVVAKATVEPPENLVTLTDGGYRSMPEATLPPKKRRRTAGRPQAAAGLHQACPRPDEGLADAPPMQAPRDSINLAVRCVGFLWNLRLTHL
jgi:hypothetical protein